ncbi:MAG: sugar nucleotide-binding protein [Fibrobacteres bacterium]|nr:sugar nucleotide-binding protein [Fibrobacterota bacterium]
MTQSQAGADAAGRPELWGGIECTLNRVGDLYLDQFRLQGHDRRPEDLDRIAGLGIRTLRYPVHWERVEPGAQGQDNWSFPDERLGRIRALGMTPIVGLLHHGSGPRWTGLLDPEFPERAARFALRVARRYPWVEAYTPVNEPLTTARFSGLYGHWHPHGRDDRSFVRALLNQCAAIALCMRAIRTITPAARLVQTEDLGMVHAAAGLGYQADFENQRRWLSYDLLCGRVSRGHPLWDYLLGSGAGEAELLAISDAPCIPDIFGFNYYVTSERWLDPRLGKYPGLAPGGNGRQAYVDAEAVRVHGAAMLGPTGLLREAWNRYRKPMAVTEAHLGCSREDQLRWLREIWEAACAVRREGVDLRAVTQWSLFGSCDWDCLVTRERGHYEPGAFDVRGPAPRPTALATLAASLANGRQPDDPVSDGPGWWHRPGRFLGEGESADASLGAGGTSRPLLIAGAGGTLGRAVAHLCGRRGIACVSLDRSGLDVANPASVRAALREVRPWGVINAAGFVRVDDAEAEAARCRRENTLGAALLADACAARGIRFATFSSDLVFDGRAARPYLESDPVAPLGVYGRSKAEAERLVAAKHPEALVIRTSAFFGPWDRYNFLWDFRNRLMRGETVRASRDTLVSPTCIPEMIDAALDLFLDGEKGIWHVANSGAASWADLARAVASLIGAGAEKVLATPTDEMGWKAPRPRMSALASERGCILGPWQPALERCLRQLAGSERP